LPGIFQVLPNHTIIDRNGDPFIIRGTAMFDYLLESWEFRGYNGTNSTNQIYRQINPYPAGSPPANGPGSTPPRSQPTYNARYFYINHANVLSQLTAAKNLGINLIRVGIEPAVQYANVSYVDPADSKTYPDDMTMLDDIVVTASTLDIVVLLTQSNDAMNQPANQAAAAAFLAFLATRYKSNPYVWITTGNEIQSMGFQTSANSAWTPDPNYGNVSAWTTVQAAYVNAIRATGFKSPIVLNPTHYSSRLDTVFSTITTTAPFNTDPNLIYGIHAYAAPVSGSGSFLVVENDWQQTALQKTGYSNFVQYFGRLPIFIEEVGINNNLGNAPAGQPPYNYDPNMGTSQSATAWQQMQNWAKDFLSWATTNSIVNGSMAGVVGTLWYYYEAGQYDSNSQHYSSGVLSTWGQIMRDYAWSPKSVAASPPLNGVGFGSYGYRNFLINGNFAINQRGFAGGTVGPGKYSYDRWYNANNVDGTISVANGVVTLASGSFATQVIEGGGLAGNTVTISLGNLTGSPAEVFIGNKNNGAAVVAIIQPGAGACSATVSLPTSNPDLAGNLHFSIAANGGTAINFTYAQVEIGSSPTAYDLRPPSIEYTMAQRYFVVLQGVAATSISPVAPTFQLPQPMASVPVISNTNVNAGSGFALNAGTGYQAVYQSAANSAVAGFSSWITGEII
jgi:Cellulase (glycosyl hydrolase family 5)